MCISTIPSEDRALSLIEISLWVWPWGGGLQSHPMMMRCVKLSYMGGHWCIYVLVTSAGRHPYCVMWSMDELTVLWETSQLICIDSCGAEEGTGENYRKLIYQIWQVKIKLSREWWVFVEVSRSISGFQRPYCDELATELYLSVTRIAQY